MIDGAERMERFDSIDKAVALVERLRNDGLETARIFRLDEVRFEVKAYYRVEVGPADVPVVEAVADGAYEPPKAQRRHPVTSLDTVPDEGAERPAARAAATIEGPPVQDPEPAVSNAMGGARRGLFGR